MEIKSMKSLPGILIMVFFNNLTEKVLNYIYIANIANTKF